MCGFYGFIGKPDINSLKKGLDLIQHRGPDSEGSVLLSDKVHLGHRRLSILDLSPSGHQPMKSQSGNLHLIFNGEIYNYQSIRNELNRSWKGHSDTEVILEGFSEWGVENALKKMKGMFALAVYDESRRVLFLARDRFGEKPLYYGKMDQNLLFGSELKSLTSHPTFRKVISRKALKSFFRYSYVPAPLSIYENVFKLMPGHFLEINIDTLEIKDKRYWDINSVKTGTSTLSFTEASQKLESLLTKAIEGQMISDVPLGAFLSGGVDSSAVVAIMQKISSKPIKTFSIGFNEKLFNEAHFAKDVAAHLKTEHHELYVSPKQALEVVPKLSHIYDEPFSDSSQIPTYLVSEMTKKHVTVALSGDAGDEVFGGYNRYFQGSKIHNSIMWMPSSIRSMIAGTITAVPPGMLDKISPISGDKWHKLAKVLNVKSGDEIYKRLISHWNDEESPVFGDENSVQYEFDALGDRELVEKMMLCDSLTYLPDDILVKVDRAAMAVSLETRVPFLDHEVTEFARSLPLKYKVANGEGKLILKDVLYRHVPRNLIDRPKMGFGVPIGDWLKNELKDWAMSLLDERKIREQGLLDYERIKVRWDEHQSGKRNWQYHLWDVLMFQDWYENSFIR